jgi:hypothetical protein
MKRATFVGSWAALAMFFCVVSVGCRKEGPSVLNFKLATGWGARYDLTLNQDAETFEYWDPKTPDQGVKGTCTTATSRFGTYQCQVTESNDPASVGTGLIIAVLSDLAVVIANAPAPGADPEGLADAGFLWQVNTDCDAIPAGTYSVTGYGLGSLFAVMQMDLENLFYRSAGYTVAVDGSSFKSTYGTTVGGGTGVGPITGSTCNTEGHHRVSFLPAGGSAYYEDLLQTTSGIAIYAQLQYAVPTSRVATLSDLAGKTFVGTYKPDIEAGSGMDQVRFTFGPVASGSVAISAYESTSTTASLSGKTIAAASNPLAGNRFSAANGTSNALRTEFPTAASVPGIFYLNIPDSLGNEQPLIFGAYRMLNGKIALMGLSQKRTGAALNANGRLVVVEE